MKTGKFCSKCLTVKPFEEFHRYQQSNDGRQRWCKACASTYSSDRHRENPGRGRTRAWRRLGIEITFEEYTRRYKEQKGVCKCCGDFYKTLSVDHDHTTGEIRGLLCSNCNSGIGLLGDTIEGLKRGISYLTAAQNASKIKLSVNNQER